MLSASFLALISFGVFFFLVIIMIRFFLFKKLSVTFGEFKGSMAVYRIVKGNMQDLQKEQSIFTRRAQSLWGKEMRYWPTFRIIFPKFANKYAVFGIIVPESFNCDKECLEELGFKFGALDSLRLSAKIEVATRFCYSLKLNQYRARKTFKAMLETNHHKKTENQIKITEFQKNLEQKYDHIPSSSKNGEIKLNNNEKAELSINVDNSINIDNSNGQNKNEDKLMINSSDETCIQENDFENDNQDQLNNQENKGKNPEVNDKINEGKGQGIFMRCNSEGKRKTSNQNYSDKNKFNDNDLEKISEMVTSYHPFAEIRYRKKKKQIFIIPILNYEELVGLWKPPNDQN